MKKGFEEEREIYEKGEAIAAEEKNENPQVEIDEEKEIEEIEKNEELGVFDPGYEDYLEEMLDYKTENQPLTLLTAKEAAKLLRVSLPTIYRIMKEGRFNVIKCGKSKGFRIEKGSLYDYLLGRNPR